MNLLVNESGAGVFSSAMLAGLLRRLCYSAQTQVCASLQLAEEARRRPCVAGRTQLVHLEQQHIAVTVHKRLDQPLGMAAGFAFLPDFLARARPISNLAA